MSHFSVLVIGDRPEVRLSSFDILSNHFDSEFNGKYDRYVLGGGWEGHLWHFDGSRVNQALKKEIKLPIIPTFAAIRHGTWYEQGNLRAYQPSKTMKPKFIWHREFHRLVDSTHDDSLFSIYDCHI